MNGKIELSLRSRIGLLMAGLGGLLMVLGGVGDLTIRSLLPSHLAFLGVGPAEVPPAAEALFLALLHALGASLVASGLAVLALLHFARVTGLRLPAVAAAVVALLAEGRNAFGLYEIGSALYRAPLGFLLLVVVGVAVCFLPRWEFAGDRITCAAPRPDADPSEAQADPVTRESRGSA